MKIEFKTGNYLFTHGRAPRGRGTWLFEYEGYKFQHIGSYTEAKAACRKAVIEAAPADYSATVYVEVCT